MPGVGPRPALSRTAVALAVVALFVFTDPVGRMATAGGESTGLKSPEVGERVAALVAAKSAGETTFYQLDLDGADLGGQDLSNLVLDGSSLARARCQDTNFARASLINVAVSGADFSGADLTGINATQLIGWSEARCNDETTMPEGWACQQGRPSSLRGEAK